MSNKPVVRPWTRLQVFGLALLLLSIYLVCAAALYLAVFAPVASATPYTH